VSEGFRRLGMARYIAAFLALCFLVPGGIAIGSAEAASGFSVKGKAGPLFPGVPGELVLTLRNPFDFAIVVHSVRVVVRDASGGCHGNNLTTPGLTTDVRLKALSSTKVTVPITMAADAPNACQGKSFPLSFSGRATRR
jgi:hypothetical protein